MKLGKLYAVLVMVGIAALQVYSAVGLVELFPISPYAMYAGKTTGQNLQLLRIACVPESTKPEFFIGEFDRFHQELDYIQMLDLDIEAQAPQVLSALLKDLNGECKSLKLYRLSWQHFSGPVRNQPEQKELLYETQSP